MINKRRRNRNNLDQLMETPEEKKPETFQYEIQKTKLQIFGYYSYKLKQNWSEQLDSSRNLKEIVYLTYLYGINLFQYIASKMDKLDKKGEIEPVEDRDSVLKYTIRSKEKKRDRLKPLEKNEGRSGLRVRSSRLAKVRNKFLSCSICEARFGGDSELILKCGGCDRSFHRDCVEEEGGKAAMPDENGLMKTPKSQPDLKNMKMGWRCIDCMKKISSRRLTRGFKRQMKMNFL